MDDSLLAFHYADRAKAFILETFHLFEYYQQLNNCRELMLEILKGCEKEITLGKNICSKITWAKDYFEEASKLARELIRDFNRGDNEQVKEDLRNMLNKMTTCAATAEKNIN
ncbi:MAG TPA: hypothetical protein GXX31_00425 [Methanothermobacter sp.]|jgi:hypothetical protein|uniref:Uncharacterized protein n=1 Tax=Methanothermobacter tenebrarum TaxID=680118 RepID=A0ABM7YE91_9EURY|nr:hypothetical protein [Methanothermobacter tenebrarum]MDD3454211.1 hypothetical protein [Methanobacteriales archaeon]MDI6881305.1 hypothetical protein [Methanothermobacter sp.]MDX9693161.1 hypothetical protein [Methanothermobacter sp.]BDH79581.1 hypothetical protein MTTB_09600 [Methanothermobacter tenebrarum]HHW15842.1 hypothetical protein [Methanothermobacter sp.]